MYDVAIVGAGVSGCSVAWELSKYKLNICIIDRTTDVCEGTSKANSGIVNSGHDPMPGTLAAKYNALGAEWIFEHADELGIECRNNGFLVVCTDKDYLCDLDELYERGKANKVRGLSIVDRNEALLLEPNLADEVVGALRVDAGGTLCPWSLVTGYAEVAAVNGVEFRLGENVNLIERKGNHYKLTTSKGIIETKYVVNAAGVYADEFHNMVSNTKLHIHPRKGQYCILDKIEPGFITRNIIPLPTKLGKGISVSYTIHGNLLIGPTALDIDDKEDTSVTQVGIDEIIAATGKMVKGIPYHTVITQYAGLRAEEDGDDFIIGEVVDSPGFINYAGMKSPGLTCSPLIAKDIRKILDGLCNLEEKEQYYTTRKPIILFKDCSKEEQIELLKENPAYGHVICRCEQITEGDILNAIHRPVGATTMDGVKRRVRAGMGRCQGGFCTPRVMEILARETGQPMEDICKNLPDSRLLFGRNKDNL